MAVDYDSNQSVTAQSGPSNGEPNASATDTPLNDATSAQAEELENNAVPKNNASPEPAKVEKVEVKNTRSTNVSKASPVIATVSEVQTTEDRVKALFSEAAKEEAKALAKEEKPAETPPSDKKKYVTLTHYHGRNFVLPWALCQTWKGMEAFIRSSYGDREEAKKEVDKGEYELSISDEAIILRDHWEMLVEPGWNVTIRLESQKGDLSSRSDDDSNVDPDETEGREEQAETIYATKVNYTIIYYMKNWRGSSDFLHSTSYDDPVVMETSDSRAKELPVLDEKRSVTIPEGSSNWHQKWASKRGPKLDVADVVGKTTLHIRSPFLLNVLRSIIKYSSKAPSGDVTDELKGGEFLHPYADLFHHKQELCEYKTLTTGPRANHTQEYNAETDRHIDLLLDYLNKESYVQIKSLEAKWENEVPTTTFAGFWLLMKPGSDVYVEEHGQLNAYVVDSVSGGIEYQSRKQWSTGAQSYSVRVWNLIYDGKVLRRASKHVFVSVFDNEKEIMSLPIFPTRFQDRIDAGARRKQLIERGKKVFRFAKRPAFLEYSGLGLRPGWKKYNRARVVVEHESQPWDRTEFNSMYEWHLGNEQTDIGERARGPRCECSHCADSATSKEKYISETFSDYDNIDPTATNELSDHQYILCMSHMFGFILKDRTYDLLDVNTLTDPRIVENAIDRLVMRPEENKETIKAIVRTYADSGQAELFSADFIHGKGEGQIFLLHGPPGTGKTLTAESVAEYTKRPLLSITAADLGHEPIELERNLLRFFKDASNWDAIVLLDEADVYLERRSVNDLRRNSIVSIFLRAMDYFQGILFLTTNRVGHFDEAFMSRIHVSIGYERLDDKARGQIWEDLFRKLKEDHKNGGPEIRYEYEAKEYVKKNDQVKTLQWNGREIRNAFQTAVALAVFDSKTAREKGSCDEDQLIPEVKEKHLNQVVTMSAAFKEYITATHEGIEDADLAFKQGIRYDKVHNKPAKIPTGA